MSFGRLPISSCTAWRTAFERTSCSTSRKCAGWRSRIGNRSSRLAKEPGLGIRVWWPYSSRPPVWSHEGKKKVSSRRRDMTDSAAERVGRKTSAVELLGKTPLFGVLHPEDLRHLADSTRTRAYERGDIIFHKDDPGYTLYIIVGGAVKISVSSSEGDEIILAILTKGQFFGELALFDDLPRSAD